MSETRNFSSDPSSVAAARRFATQALIGIAAELLEAVELMVSEAATNCIRHAHTEFSLTIRRTRQEIRVEATDHAGGTPAMRSPEPTDPTGRGLRIIDMLSESWGVDYDRPGKTLWFTVRAPDSPEASRANRARGPVLR